MAEGVCIQLKKFCFVIITLIYYLSCTEGALQADYGPVTDVVRGMVS